MKPLPRVGLLVAILMAGMLAGCTDVFGGRDDTEVVEMRDGRFSTASLTVPSGTPILFRNLGTRTHTFTAALNVPGALEVEVAAGAEKSLRLETPRVYDGGCRFHPEMRLRIEVTG